MDKGSVISSKSRNAVTVATSLQVSGPAAPSARTGHSAMQSRCPPQDRSRGTRMKGRLNPEIGGQILDHGVARRGHLQLLVNPAQMLANRVNAAQNDSATS